MAPVGAELVQSGLGSTDWNGGYAPAGGTHTGASTVTTRDGKTFLLAHSVAEVRAKMAAQSRPPASGDWVAFDAAGSVARSVVLRVTEIATVD